MSQDTKGMYKRGNVWWFYYSQDGQQFHQSTKCKTIPEALEYRQNFLQELAKQFYSTGGTVPIIGQVHTESCLFDTAVLKFLDEKERTLSPKTLRGYHCLLRKNLVPYFSGKLMEELTLNCIKNYEDYRLLNHASYGLIRAELSLLKNIITFANSRGMTEQNVFLRYNFTAIYQNYRPRTRFLQPIECQRLVAVANPCLARIIIFILETGVRIGELTQLLFTDIAKDMQREVFILHIRTEISKSKRERFIPLSPQAMAQVNQQRIAFANSSFIFTDEKGNNYQTVPKTAMYNAGAKAGLPRVLFHILRHTAGSFWLQGIDYLGQKRKPLRIEVVSEILGHTDIAFTKKVYAQFDVGRLAIEFLDR